MFIRSLIRTAALATLPLLAFAQTACNNSPSLCDRAYNNITHLGTHDAAFVRDASTNFNTAGNQFYNATVQLSAGVRLLTAQVHKFNTSSGATEWHLCHSDCGLLDAGKLETWLTEIKTWMDANPNDVVTVLLVNSDNASADILGAQVNSSGIARYAYTPPSTTNLPQTWPTLNELIKNGTRLMTFVASLSTLSPTYPYLMDEFTFIYENDYNNNHPSDFSCDPNRPTGLTTATARSSKRMFLMNHFLYSTQLFGIQTPNVTYANVTNAISGTGSLGDALINCTTAHQQAPQFVLVDFFNVGPAIDSVDKVNLVTGAIGRKSISTAPLEQPASSGVQKGGSVCAVVVAVVAAVAFGM